MDDWGDALEREPEEGVARRDDWLGDTHTLGDASLGTGLIQGNTQQARILQRHQQRGEERANVESRFVSTVTAIATAYSNQQGGQKKRLVLSQSDIETMTRQNLYKKKYLNPTAYVLGYYVSQGGTDMSPANVVARLEQVETDILSDQPAEVGVNKIDVIRYARFWESLHRLGS